jgi:hypothetical protein
MLENEIKSLNPSNLWTINELQIGCKMVTLLTPYPRHGLFLSHASDLELLCFAYQYIPDNIIAGLVQIVWNDRLSVRALSMKDGLGHLLELFFEQ